ncbi:MAG: hypothetical protein KKD00_08510 [Gammaproteobacteria bacterium]|nr:hypothetical protein [Gammaproteobacteria bacterium]
MPSQDKSQEELIERYLQRRLSEEELVAFEIRMLEQPELFEAVQKTELMQTAFKSQPALPQHHSNVRYLPLTRWIQQPMSIAASLLLAVSLVMVANNYSSSAPGGSMQSGLAVNSVVNIGQTRSTAEDIVLTSGVHLLQVDVGVSLIQEPYQLRMSSEDNRQVYNFSVMADGNGIVRILTPDGLTGRYQLTAQQPGSDASTEPSWIRFN